MTRHYADTETRRQQIAEAALQVLADEGAARFTTRAIASRVGITDGTIFRHFKDKQEIVLAAMDLLEQEITREMHHVADPVERLEAWFRHRAAYVGATGSVGRLIFSEQLVHLAGPAGAERVAGWRRHNLEVLTATITEAGAAGRTVAGLPPIALAQVVQGILLTFALQGSLERIASAPPLEARVQLSWQTLKTLLFR